MCESAKVSGMVTSHAIGFPLDRYSTITIVLVFILSHFNTTITFIFNWPTFLDLLQVMMGLQW